MSRRSVLKVSSRSTSIQTGTNRGDEKEKLVSLIKAWRYKYEELLATSQKHFDELEKNRAELKDVKAAKLVEVEKLQEQLVKERNELQQRITKLQTVADTAKTEADVVCRDLTEKLARIQKETKPVINGFKLREDKLTKKLEQTQHEVEFLKNEIENLREKLNENADANIKAITVLENKNRELKESYINKMRIVRIHCVQRIAAARQREDAKEILTNAHTQAQEHTIVKNAVKDKDTQLILLRTSYNMEKKELEEEIEKIRQNSEDEKKKVIHSMNGKIRQLRKKIELGRLKLHHREAVKEELQEYIVDVNKRLSKVRHTHHSDILKGSKNNNLAALSRHLGELHREFAAIERALRRHDHKQLLGIGGDTSTYESVRLELMHSAKVAEINKTKHRIKQQRMNCAYDPSGSSIHSSMYFGGYQAMSFLKDGYGYQRTGSPHSTTTTENLMAVCERLENYDSGESFQVQEGYHLQDEVYPKIKKSSTKNSSKTSILNEESSNMESSRPIGSFHSTGGPSLQNLFKTDGSSFDSPESSYCYDINSNDFEEESKERLRSEQYRHEEEVSINKMSSCNNLHAEENDEITKGDQVGDLKHEINDHSLMPLNNLDEDVTINNDSVNTEKEEMFSENTKSTLDETDNRSIKNENDTLSHTKESFSLSFLGGLQSKLSSKLSSRRSIASITDDTKLNWFKTPHKSLGSLRRKPVLPSIPKSQSIS